MMIHQKTALVIGTGAGGAMMAKELQGRYQVTILEEGKAFTPFSLPLNTLSGLRKTGLFLDERMIQLLFPAMRIRKTPDMVLVTGRGLGGTTTLATGNAVRYDGPLRALGIDLDEQFDELYLELPITTDHRSGWNEATKKLYHLFEHMALDPVVTPKFMHAGRCVSCGQCVFGCRHGAKWDSRALVDEAVAKGATLVTGCRVTHVDTAANAVTKVHASTSYGAKTYEADVVVLAAGGMGTPAILQQSGIACQQRLFVDPVLCVAARMPGAGLDRQLPMPFISQQEKYILSPYMDWLSFFFNRQWKHPAGDIMSLMIKMADNEQGGVSARKADKTLSTQDQAVLKIAVEQCTELLLRMGIRREDVFLGTVNAGHPGGMLPLTAADRDTLHPAVLPGNLYVADASLFPASMGNPPMLTIMALSKAIAQKIST